MAAALMAAMLLGAACSGGSKTPPRPVAGVMAAEGGPQVTSPLDRKFRRTAKAGMALCSDQVIEIPKGGRVVLEDGATRFHLLKQGTWKLGTLRGLNANFDEPRPVTLAIPPDEAVQATRQPLVLVARYEPLWSVQPKDVAADLFGGDQDAAAAAKFFFSRGGDDSATSVPAGDVSPRQAAAHRVKPLGRIVRQADGGIALVSFRGTVVVEFGDHATAFADDLKLPVPLETAVRVVVLDDGKAMVSLNGKDIALSSGQVMEIQGPSASK